MKSKHAEITATYAKIRLLITDDNIELNNISFASSPKTKTAGVETTESANLKDIDTSRDKNPTSDPESRNDHVYIVPLNDIGGCVVTEMWPQQMNFVRKAMFEHPVSELFLGSNVERF